MLLDRIREERAHLIKEKKIKAPKGGESVIYLGSDGRRYEKRVDAKGRESELLIAPFLLHRSTLHCYSVPWQTAT